MQPLPISSLRWRCSAERLQTLDKQGISSELLSEDQEVVSSRVQIGAVGEEWGFISRRAVDAIELGLSMDAPGYHVYVSGQTGSGKTSAVKQLLKQLQRPERPRYDYIYLHNFEDSDRPRLCVLPQGEGRSLKRALIHFVESISEVLLSTLHSTRLANRRRSLSRQLEDALAGALASLQEECAAHGFIFEHSEEGFGASEVKVRVGRRKILTIEEWVTQVSLGKIKGDIDEKIEIYEHLNEQLHNLWDQLSQLEWDLTRHISEVEVDELRLRLALRADALFFTASDKQSSEREGHESPEGAELDPIYQAVNLEIKRWFDGLIDWVDDHLEELKQVSEESGFDAKDLRLLKANLIHEAPQEPPLIFESSPTLINLMGTIERSGDDNHAQVDFGDIRSGSLLKANGGILVINANDLSQEGTSTWRFLLRALREHQLEIQSPDQLFASGGSPIKPAPIPLDVKVIAIGDDDLYRVLYVTNDEFSRVFKVKAEFDDSFPNDDLGLVSYMKHARRVQQEEDLKPFSYGALSLWCEYGTRLSGRNDRLSTQLGILTDVLREAGYYASLDKGDEVTVDQLRRALRLRFDRHRLTEDHLFEMIEMSLLELRPVGEAVGVIHGLTVLDFGDHVFGHPCRISATHAPGERGVISVEREARLSGRSHDKGALHVSAFLRALLPDVMCALSATLSFDQVHDEVDGDSASLAELLSLLSSLSGVPLNQEIAVTGAIDQRGNVQAVGGVNEKIEGFFRLCKQHGFTGKQGAVIPKSTLKELSLKLEVLEAIEAGQFTIWSIERVEEAADLVCSSGHQALWSGAIDRMRQLSEIASSYRAGSSS